MFDEKDTQVNKGNAIYYELGDNKIKGLNYQLPASTDGGQTRVYQTSIKRIIAKLYGLTAEQETKVVAMSKPVGDDEFDKYIGVALALAYVTFGSKTKFHKYVDSLKTK